jgi:hypothetical protein
MFCRKGASKYSHFISNDNNKVKSLLPKEKNKLSAVSYEKQELSDNILQFSLRNCNENTRYDKNTNSIAEVTDARLEYRFLKSVNKLNNLVNQGYIVKDYE